MAIGTAGIGGAEKQLMEFAVRVPSDRYEVTMLMPPGGGAQLLARLREAGMGIVEVQPIRPQGVTALVRVVREYIGALRSFQPDIVYAWLDEAAALLAPLCHLGRIPCIAARRNIAGSTELAHPLLGRAIRKAESLANIVTANSAAVAAECIQRGYDSRHVRVIPNGHEHVPPLEFPPAPPVVFGYVANYRKGKGHDRLIDVLERMPSGPWRVDLAGDGPLRDEIRARIIGLGLESRVRLLGVVTDIRQFWQHRHAALLLSDMEGSPNALLEAAFAGRPAIGTAVGGIPEIIGPGGILVPLDDCDAIVDAMQALVRSSSLRETLGTRIWHHVAENNSMPKAVSGHLAVIDELWQPRRHRSHSSTAAKRAF